MPLLLWLNYEPNKSRFDFSELHLSRAGLRTASKWLTLEFHLNKPTTS